MNKKYLLPTILCGLIFCVSCKKNTPASSPQPQQPFDYSASVITDTVIVPANDMGSFKANLTVLSGNPAEENVFIEFKNLPPNISVSGNTYLVKPVNVNNILTEVISAHNATPGVYPAQAIFSNATAGTKTEDFYIRVTSPIDRVSKVLGYFYPTNGCGTERYISCTIEAISDTPGKIRLIDRISLTGVGPASIYDTTYGTVDCCSNIFSIPAQRVRGRTVEGSATFNTAYSPARITLSRTFITDTLTYKCIVTLETK